VRRQLPMVDYLDAEGNNKRLLIENIDEGTL
jgi:hypothetical protein